MNKFGVLGSTAAVVAMMGMAVPAEAQWRRPYRGHHRGDGGAGLVIGALALGGVIALAASANRARQDVPQEDDGYYPPLPPSHVTVQHGDHRDDISDEPLVETLPPPRIDGEDRDAPDRSGVVRDDAIDGDVPPPPPPGGYPSADRFEGNGDDRGYGSERPYADHRGAIGADSYDVDPGVVDHQGPVSDDWAVDRCASAAEDQARSVDRNARIGFIQRVEPTGNGWTVGGTISFAGRSGRPGVHNFTCSIAEGGLPNVGIEGLR